MRTETFDVQDNVDAQNHVGSGVRPVHLVTDEATQTMSVYGLETITLGWYTLSNYNYVKTMFERFAAPNIRQGNMEVSLL